MSVGGGVAVAPAFRREQTQFFNDRRRAEIEDFSGRNDGFQFAVLQLAGAVGVYVNAERLGDTDGVGHLHFAFFGQSGGNNVFGHITGVVRGRTVNLGRVFSGERSTAVAADAAVGVDDNFAAGEPGVAVRSADDEFAGRVDKVFDVAFEQTGRAENPFRHFDEVFTDRFERHVGGLVRNHHGGDVVRASIDVFDGDLRFRVGPQIRNSAGFADFLQLVEQQVAVVNRRRHQRFGFVGSIAEHHALVARALLMGFGRGDAL